MTTPTRREWLTWAAAGVGNISLRKGARADAVAGRVSLRPAAADRRFVSAAVDAAIVETKRRIADPDLAWLFENCLPNTLDTTVTLDTRGGKPDAFVITGDIDAMWLRDSSAQMWPYLPFVRDDPALQRLYRGVIGRHARSILIDPYANAFSRDPSAPTQLRWALADKTEMRPGVAERKYEIDSLCWSVRLAHGYWRATGDTTPFDAEWANAMQLVVATLTEQQRKHGPGPYTFQRAAEAPTETLALGGYGNPARPTGMICSMFRPSDDACTYAHFVPGNLFAVSALRQLAALADCVLHDAAFATRCAALADEVAVALQRHGRMSLGDAASPQVWAYEVDGYGNRLFMDDANAPSLLSLPYLGCCSAGDPLYRRTRSAAWSTANPYYFAGSAADGIGGPHEGLRMIWPMSLIMRALTSLDDGETRRCLQALKATHAGTGFMHEAFDQDDASHYTRPWFAWANALFGELIFRLAWSRPALLRP